MAGPKENEQFLGGTVKEFMAFFKVSCSYSTTVPI
jgi:hypothetical protein